MSTLTGKSTGCAVTTPGDRTILVERIFNAPRERVWRAWTDPEQIAQWWGRGNRVEVESLELERGGRWRYVEYGPNGVFGYEGRFREVAPPERIVQTFEWDGMPGHVLVRTTTFEDLGDSRTRLTMLSLFHTGEERDGMLASGMQPALDAAFQGLVALLER